MAGSSLAPWSDVRERRAKGHRRKASVGYWVVTERTCRARFLPSPLSQSFLLSLSLSRSLLPYLQHRGIDPDRSQKPARGGGGGEEDLVLRKRRRRRPSLEEEEETT